MAEEEGTVAASTAGPTRAGVSRGGYGCLTMLCWRREEIRGVPADAGRQPVGREESEELE